MSNCPNGCDSLNIHIILKTTPNAFASLRDEIIRDRKGVVDYEWRVESGNLIEKLYIDQSTYKKHNYFKYRSELESDSRFRVEDVKDDIVEVEFDCDLVVPGDKCMDCGSINSNYSNHMNQNKEYDTTTGQWVSFQTV